MTCLSDTYIYISGQFCASAIIYSVEELLLSVSVGICVYFFLACVLPMLAECSLKCCCASE